MKNALFKAYRALIVRPFAGRGWAGRLGLKKVQTALWSRLVPQETVEFRGARFRCAPDDHVFSIALHSGRYEDFELDLLLSKLETGMNVLDVGANIGIFSILAGKRLADVGGGSVYSIEADPDNFSYLSNNVALNGLKNVIATHRAASDATGHVLLHRAPDNKGGHSLAVDFGGEAVRIDAAPLDSVVPVDAPIHMLKMDIEGWEAHAFRGMKRILADQRLKYVFIEFAASAIEAAGDDPAKFLQELQRIGFELEWIKEGARKTDPLPDDLIEISRRELVNLIGVRKRPTA